MNKKHLEELYERSLKDYDEEVKENKYLQAEIESLKYDIESLKNYKHKIDKENFELHECVAKYLDRLNELETECTVLKRYIKTIQEYLCKGIFDMIKKEYEDGEDEFYED